MKHIINDLQKQREIERKKRVAEKLRDDKMIEYAQTRWEYHKTLGNVQRRDFYEWVLEIVDRLDEAEYDKENLVEQVKEYEEYIRELEVEDTTWKDTWYKR